MTQDTQDDSRSPLTHLTGPLVFPLAGALCIAIVVVGMAHNALATVVPGWAATLALAAPIGYGVHRLTDHMAASVRGENA